MSTDGTKPPSIAPRGAGTGTASARPRPAAPPPRSDAPPPPAPAPAPGGAAPAGATPPGTARPQGEAADGSPKPSVADRLKKAASSAAQSARNAVPAREANEQDEVRGPATARPATARPASARPAAARPAGAPEPERQADGGPRKVRLAVARVDPWSVMKLAFLLSVAVGIMIVVASAVVWFALDGLEVFTRVNDTITEITGNPEFFNLLEYVAFDRVLSLATMIAVVDVVLLTALSTIAAFLYNIVATLVGGVSVTLTDD